LTFAMDLTPLIEDVNQDISAYVQAYINHFAQDVTQRIGKMGRR